MLKGLSLGILIGATASITLALSQSDQVKINEVYFAGSVTGALQDGFIELYNAGNDIAYLDGAILAQGPDTLSQLGYKFPGEPGGTAIPLMPGEYLVIAIDAYDFSASDPSSPNLAFADFETVYDFEQAPGDNAGVSNMEDALQAGYDWFFNRDWGQVTLSTGIGWWVRICSPGQACGNIVMEIPLESIVDGIEYLRAAGDTLPILNDAIDEGAILGVSRYAGESAERVSPGYDTNNSYNDFVVLAHSTPGTQNTQAAENPRGLPSSPHGFEINSVYPNPFNSSTSIAFTLSVNGSVDFGIYDILGRAVVLRNLGWFTAGAHQYRWDAAGVQGGGLASGVYLLRLSSAGVERIKTVHYIR